jgi:16S rRNA U1498 N3-methylase RsmE
MENPSIFFLFFEFSCMQRFFIKNFQSTPLFVLNDESIVYQINTVLRSKESERFIFFDGVQPTDYVYELVAIKKRELHFR